MKEYVPCPEGDDGSSTPFNPCAQKARYQHGGWHMNSHPPYSQSAHTFGFVQTSQQTFHFFSASIGDGTSSLIDATGSHIDSGDWIIGNFPATTGDNALCCGANYWGTHTNAPQKFDYVGGTKTHWGAVTCWDEGHTTINYDADGDGVPETYTYPAYYSSGDYDWTYGYQSTNKPLKWWVYDPFRDLVVSASIYTVSMSNGKPIVDQPTILSGCNPEIHVHTMTNFGDASNNS